MSALTWEGVPVRVILVEPRYQVIVDAEGIGEVASLGNGWRYKHYEGYTGYADSRREAVDKLLAEHGRLISLWSNPEAGS